jgi:hypothetical protein
VVRGPYVDECPYDNRFFVSVSGLPSFHSADMRNSRRSVYYFTYLNIIFTRIIVISNTHIKNVSIMFL